MSMGIGIHADHKDSGVICGKQEAVACGVWFTSTGAALPKMIKFQDEEGEVHALTNIHVIAFEEKFYCGIPTIEYECDTVFRERKQQFRLLFYIEKREWKILWKHK